MNIIKKSSLIYQRKDNELVILNMDNGKYYGLQDSGIEIWDLIDKYTTKEKIAAYLKDSYNDSNVLDDLNLFIEELKKEGLIFCEKS